MNLEYTDTIQPRISDINYGGHLGHIELISLLHEIRLRFLNLYSLTEDNLGGNVLLVRNLNITYKNQAYWGNNLEINMQMKISGAKILFNYNIVNLTSKNETADAEIVMVLFSKQHKRIVKPENLVRTIKNASCKG